MSGRARATLSNGRKSSSVHELGRIRKSGPPNDHSGRDGRKDRTLLERLEAENRELRNQAIQLALQIQVLHSVSKSETRSRGSRAPKRESCPPAADEPGPVGMPAATSRLRPAPSP
jgi:hypothetical protein